MSDNSLTINGRLCVFEKGETLLEVARHNGIFIPTLCYLKGATPTGACRICLVEVDKARNLVPSCSMPASPGMVVRTESSRVVASRRFTLSLLLSSGNHNCASRNTPDNGEWTSLLCSAAAYDKSQELCSVYGTCTLQSLAYRYQVDYRYFKRTLPRYPLEDHNPLIVRDFSRCIQCGRCVQACNEIQVNRALSQGYRGKAGKIVVRGDSPLVASDCVFCGECVQVCPVGALVEKKSRFIARPWEIKKSETVCHHCGVGCRMTLEVGDNKIVRVRGNDNEAPNYGRLCGRGRFAYDFLQSPDRLLHPLIKRHGSLKPGTYAEAFEQIVSKLKPIMQTQGPESVAVLVGPGYSTEDYRFVADLFHDRLKVDNIQYSEVLAVKGRLMTDTFADIESASALLLLGSEIDTVHPVAGAAIKRAVLKGAPLIILDSEEGSLARFASLFLKIRPGSEGVILNALLQAVTEKSGPFTLNQAAETSGVSVDRLQLAVDCFKAGPVTALYSADRIRQSEMIETLALLCAGVNTIPLSANTAGALSCGLYSNHFNIEEALLKGTIRVLVCFGSHPILTAPSAKRPDLTVVFSLFRDSFIEQADVVLPHAAWVESEGSVVNGEGRVGRFVAAVSAPNNILPVWAILCDLGLCLGYSDLAFTPAPDKEEKPLPLIFTPHDEKGSFYAKQLVDKSRDLAPFNVIPSAKAVDAAFDAFLESENMTHCKGDADKIIAEYQGKKGTLIMALQRFQTLFGYLPKPVQDYLSLHLNVPGADVYGIVSFYAFFTMKPRGKSVIKVCLGTACYVMGADKLLQKFEELLHLKVGETAPDRSFTLESVRCVGACGLAPVVLVNDKTHGKLVPDDVAKLLNALRPSEQG